MLRAAVGLIGHFARDAAVCLCWSTVVVVGVGVGVGVADRRPTRRPTKPACSAPRFARAKYTAGP